MRMTRKIERLVVREDMEIEVTDEGIMIMLTALMGGDVEAKISIPLSYQEFAEIVEYIKKTIKKMAKNRDCIYCKYYSPEEDACTQPEKCVNGEHFKWAI